MIAVAIFLLLVCALPDCRAQSKPPSTTSQEPAGSLPKTKASLDKILKLLDGYTTNDISAEEVIGRISLGLDFKADPETIKLLKEHGATDAMLEEIRKHAEKEPPKGAVAVRCEPAECKISIDGQLADTTLEGRFIKRDLTVGRTYTIHLERDGYITGEQVLQASVEPAKEVVVSLEPTEATKLRLGKRLYDLMMRALGDNLKALQSITAVGSATTYRSGKPASWQLDVTTAPPRLIEMHATSPLGALLYGCSGERCAEKKKGLPFFRGGTKLTGAAALDLGSSLNQFANLNLVSILQTIGAPGLRLSARTANARGKEEQRLEVGSPEGAYVIALAPDLLPVSAEYKPRSGLGAARITYGSYIKLADCSYPKDTVITLEGSAESGIAVKFDHVELGSKLRASDLGK